MYKSKSKTLYKTKYTKEGYLEILKFVFNI